MCVFCCIVCLCTCVCVRVYVCAHFITASTAMYGLGQTDHYYRRGDFPALVPHVLKAWTPSLCNMVSLTSPASPAYHCNLIVI